MGFVLSFLGFLMGIIVASFHETGKTFDLQIRLYSFTRNLSEDLEKYIIKIAGIPSGPGLKFLLEDTVIFNFYIVSGAFILVSLQQSSVWVKLSSMVFLYCKNSGEKFLLLGLAANVWGNMFVISSAVKSVSP